MPKDLRCENGIMFGAIIEPGVIEFRCKSNRCGHRPGVVILHRFSTLTGEPLVTLRFQEPMHGRSKKHDHANSASLRSA